MLDRDALVGATYLYRFDLVTGDGLRPMSVLVRRSTLEDVFLLLTGRTLED